ncbi:MAG: LptF/LptG family permease, partial [Gammaproteobacteria bacterium]|nr:LptF/LptG family permease [Gammaproteobacteria bacterium]
QLSLLRLQEQSKYNKQNGLDSSTYTLAFWLRVLQPLATLVMVFLAIPFIFGPLRSSTMGLRILSGVMAGLAFYIINRFFGPFTVVYQIPPIVAAVTPILLFALLACILIRRKG